MLCDNCKKNQAAVFIEQVINGEKSEINLCYRCSIDVSKPMLLNNILKSMFYSGANSQDEKIEEHNCESCGLTLAEFRHSGKLGCKVCYQTFRKELNQVLKNVQWGMEHKGKIPKKNASNLILKKEIQQLRNVLKVSIENEEYEEAACLRDKIKELENSNKERGEQ